MFKELINLKGRHGLTEWAGHVVGRTPGSQVGFFVTSGNSSAKRYPEPPGMYVEVLCSL